MPAGHVLRRRRQRRGRREDRRRPSRPTTARLASAARVLQMLARRERAARDARWKPRSSATTAPPTRIRAAIAAAGDDEFGAELLRKRFDQFVLESRTIVPGAGDALARRRPGPLRRARRSVAAGRRATAGQPGARDRLRSPATARRLGAAAASAFGAGFGGSVWAMVAEERSEGFRREWRRAYEGAHPQAAARAVFFETAPGPAAFRLA